jgi:hypothetical protein
MRSVLLVELLIKDPDMKGFMKLTVFFCILCSSLLHVRLLLLLLLTHFVFEGVAVTVFFVFEPEAMFSSL